jgi:hypothetical protein
LKPATRAWKWKEANETEVDPLHHTNTAFGTRFPQVLAALTQQPQDAKSTPHRGTIFGSPLLSPYLHIAIKQVRSDSSCFRRSTIAMAV